MPAILNNHISAETAYVVADYPYGFRLRCQVRYWLDSDPKRGTRLMTQTSNPKLSTLVWNKPKASTYCRFGGAMFLDDNGHVHWSGLHEYMDGAQVAEWVNQYGEGVPETMRPLMRKWLCAKLAYDARKTAA